MKNIFKSLFALSACIVMFSACEKITTDGVTGVTYYPEFTLEGEDFMVIPRGTAYVEPGFTAIMKGEDVSKDVVVSGSVDNTKVGLYTIKYLIVNPDGFSAMAEREVVVYDLNVVEGVYSSTIKRDNAGTIASRGPFILSVTKTNVEGEYIVEDLLGCWYSLGSGYGPDYASKGTIKINPDNSVEVTDSPLPGFNDTVVGAGDCTYNPDTYTLKLTTMMVTAPAMIFTVNLKKVQ